MGKYSLTSALGLGMRLALARRIRLLSDLDYWKRNTARIQVDQLRSLLERAKGTQIGRQHRFERLAAIADPRELLRAYREELPARDISAFREQIAMMREEARPDVLWPGLVKHYAQTSGTTAGDKFIPVSAEMMKSNRRAAFDIFANANRFGLNLPALTGGKSLFLGGSTEFSVSPKGIATGDLSGIVTPLIRWPLTKAYLPGKDIALMSHWPSKIEAMARRCVNEDVRMVSGMCSWMLVLFERLVQIAREQGRDAKTLRDVWPNMTLLVHGGVKYGPFDPRMRAAWSGAADGADFPCRLELYPASEGFIAMQDTRGDPGLRLCSDIGNFYEFIPLSEIDAPQPRAFMCHEVQKGVPYVVVMSTCAGLYRYIIGDVVMFDTIPGGLDGSGGEGPARLRIVGRHRHFINAFGENLIVEHIENAVTAAMKTTGATIGEFTASPVYPGEGRRAGLELVIESPAPLPGAYAKAFDASLMEQNVDYATKRTGGVGMVEPTVTVVPMGTVHRWMASRGKLGGQHKVPRCANHRDFVDALRVHAGVDGSPAITTRTGAAPITA